MKVCSELMRYDIPHMTIYVENCKSLKYKRTA